MLGLKDHAFGYGNGESEHEDQGVVSHDEWPYPREPISVFADYFKEV